MRVLIVGAGVIGTVYGAHLASAGHAVAVLRHGSRGDQVARDGLTAQDVISGARTTGAVSVVEDAGGGPYDLVLVAVRREQLAGACVPLTMLGGAPALIFLGNNPDGRAAIDRRLRGPVLLGFPGVGGIVRDGTADYVLIPQQPTALPPPGRDPRADDFARTLTARGLAVQRVADMDGWLAYHAAFVGCIAAALFRSGTDPVRLAGDRPGLTLMSAAITEAFTALHRAGVRGRPRNLAVLHQSLLRAVAVRYWARTMRSPMGELCFAAHCRHAEAEMQALGAWVLHRLAGAPGTTHLQQLLGAEPG